MGALYSHTTRATGTTLTAAIYNADHQNHIDNGVPAQLDDYSTNAAQMQSTTNPGAVGSESLATSLAGELERLRYVIKLVAGGAQWYAPAVTFSGSVVQVSGGITTTAAVTIASGALTVTGGTVTTGAATALSLATTGGTQVQVTNTASADRHVTLTGSNGGNPAIGVSAGNLAITPTVVCASDIQISRDADALSFLVDNANTGSSTGGIRVRFTGSTFNDATHIFLAHYDGTSTLRHEQRANGGYANFQANDANLSSREVKTDIKPYSPEFLDAAFEALRRVDWGTYKYRDQTHDDPNHGPTAEGVEAAFAELAPELVDDSWHGKKVIYTHDLGNIAIAALLHRVAQLEAK